MNGFGDLQTMVRALANGLTDPVALGTVAWLLALVFCWSGFVKIRRPRLATVAIRDFGIPVRGQRMAGLALGVLECLVATLILIGTLTRAALLAATVLLWLFSLLLARGLRSGRVFACFCFGSSESRISRWTLLRTFSLAVVATYAVVSQLSNSAVTLRQFPDTLVELIVAVSALGVVTLMSRMPTLLAVTRKVA